jgi:iron complex transport system substrate-binding protein
MFTCCNRKLELNNLQNTNECKYAKGLIIQPYDNYYKVTLNQIFDNQKETYTYILCKKNVVLADSLKKYQCIHIPVNRFIATSSTHIPPLELLNVEKSLIGFPHLDYISSPKTRMRINQNQVKDIGQNQALNIEQILLLKPDLIMGFGVNEASKDYDFLSEKQIPIIYNGEWRETHPLGKAEWLKLFGLLFDKYELSKKFFSNIEKNYQALKIQAQTFSYSPTVMSGSLYENIWYAPKGDSWGAQMIKDAGGQYLWANEKGQGSVSLSFEDVLLQAKNADFWIGCAFESYKDTQLDQSNYKHFKSFKNKKVYSYTMKKGETAAVIYFENAVYEPHLVLKDLINIFHNKNIDDKSFHYLTPLNY